MVRGVSEADCGLVSSDVEIYLARLLAISLFTISIITLFFTGTIPVSSNSIPPVTSTTSTSTDPESPYTTPILVTTTLFHSLCTFYTYARYTQDGTSGYVLGAAGYGALASIGVWCLVFGTGPGRVSGRTGMDKRTSRWLSGKGSGREKLV